jgi:predicted glycoside hydrolase/deacetylase ChbG (UPF0249 family)
MENPSAKILVVNADDFGLLPEVNQGIIECFEAGSITSTTLMVNTGGVRDAVRLARRHPDLGVGLHFNLTQGKPVSAAGEIPSLVDDCGRFHRRARFEKKMILGHINPRDLEKEFAAQLNKFKAWGLGLTHIDSHHHVHMFGPVFKIASNYARDLGLPLRVPWVSYGWVAPTLRARALKPLLKKLALTLLTLKLSNGCRNGFRAPDTFMSIHDYIPFPQRIEQRHFLNLIDSAPCGTTEIMVHPAYATPALKRMFPDAHIKDQERKVLTRRSLLKQAQASGFKTASYRPMEN